MPACGYGYSCEDCKAHANKNFIVFSLLFLSTFFLVPSINSSSLSSIELESYQQHTILQHTWNYTLSKSTYITTSNYTINSLHKEQTKGMFHKLQRTSFNFLFDFIQYQSNLIVDMHPFSSFKLVNA